MDDDMDRYWTHSTASAKSSSKPALPTTTSRAQKDLDRLNWIRKCAQAVLSSYRRDDFADADGFAVQLAMVLERYDDAIIREVTSPITGIQRTCKFPPSIAEMVEFIEEHIRRTSYAKQYDARSREQLREREERERAASRESSEHRRAVAERIKGELRGHGFRFPSDGETETKPQQETWKRFTVDELQAIYPRRERTHDGTGPERGQENPRARDPSSDR
jgi:hypothetical protein